MVVWTVCTLKIQCEQIYTITDRLLFLLWISVVPFVMCAYYNITRLANNTL